MEEGDFLATQALYLKWRPQAFDEVIGQDHITRTLRNALKQGRIRHAYLFSGPRGTGKTTNARLLAKAVNCTHPDFDVRPCNECHNCQMVNEGRFLDLIEIDAASHTGVDDVRDLRDKIAFAPSEGRYKVYIIDEVHRFSGAAFDALLKTLEEPPAHAIFVLATTEIDKVPATIKSRCLMFEFRRVSVREVVQRLQNICDDEKISIDQAALELIARQGTGSVRDSISLLDQILADPDQHVTLELAQQMLGVVGGQAVHGIATAVAEGNTTQGLDLLNEAIDMGADPRQFGQQIVDYLRNIMLTQVSGSQLVDASDEQRKIYEQLAQKISRPQLLKAIRAFNTAVADLRGGWQPQLPLELALVESTQPVQEVVVQAAAPAPRYEKARARTQEELPPPTDTSFISTDAGVINITTIKSGWGQLIQATKRRRPTLPALLDWCDPLKIDGAILVLSLRNGMLRPKLEDPRNMTPLQEALQETFGHRLAVRIEIAGAQGSNKAQHVDDELADFGVSELGAEITELD